MSAISEAFDSLPPLERLELLVSLEFDDPMRYAAWEEEDLRYCCLFYEVQTELGHCFSRGKWTATPHVVKPPRAERSTKASSAARQAIADGIKDFRITISRG